MIRVRVVASSPVLRVGLESIIRDDPRFQVVSSFAASSAASRPAGAGASLVNVLLVETGNGMPFTARDGQIDGPAVVLLCDPLGRTELRRALASGVRAVLPRQSGTTEILAAIEAVAAGLAVLTTHDLDTLLPASAEEANQETAAGEDLSSRETEILGMLAEGMANKEIAQRLNISEHTVKFHVSSILGKLGAGTRGEAVARGVRQGLVVI